MQLCPQGAAAWRGNPRLPSRACKFSSALTAKAYGAAGLRSPSLANSSEEGSPFLERGHPLAPTSRLVESPSMVPGWDAEVLGGLPPAVVNTITSARAPSTRHAYRLKWNLFVDWCSPRREDPLGCPIAVVLSFLQDGLERRLSPSTLKVYVAHFEAVAAHHDTVDGKSVGKHDLVIRFVIRSSGHLVYLSRMTGNTGTCSVSITLAAPFPSTDQIRALCCFLVQFPTANPVEVPPAPSAVRRGGAPDARFSTRVLPKVSPCAGLGARV